LSICLRMFLLCLSIWFQIYFIIFLCPWWCLSNDKEKNEKKETSLDTKKKKKISIISYIWMIENAILFFLLSFFVSLLIKFFLLSFKMTFIHYSSSFFSPSHHEINSTLQNSKSPYILTESIFYHIYIHLKWNIFIFITIGSFRCNLSIYLRVRIEYIFLSYL
jgi:hypothetical protein